MTIRKPKYLQMLDCKEDILNRLNTYKTNTESLHNSIKTGNKEEVFNKYEILKECINNNADHLILKRLNRLFIQIGINEDSKKLSLDYFKAKQNKTYILYLKITSIIKNVISSYSNIEDDLKRLNNNYVHAKKSTLERRLRDYANDIYYLKDECK